MFWTLAAPTNLSSLVVPSSGEVASDARPAASQFACFHVPPANTMPMAASQSLKYTSPDPGAHAARVVKAMIFLVLPFVISRKPLEINVIWKLAKEGLEIVSLPHRSLSAFWSALSFFWPLSEIWWKATWSHPAKRPTCQPFSGGVWACSRACTKHYQVTDSSEHILTLILHNIPQIEHVLNGPCDKALFVHACYVRTGTTLQNKSRGKLSGFPHRIALKFLYR